MFICIPDILDAGQLAKLAGQMDKQEFIDGAQTAGWAAAGVKKNRQVSAASPGYAAMQDTVSQALAANRIFALAAMPKAMRPILFSRYGPGAGYDWHVDNALMGDAPQTRTDLAFTLFLSAEEDYEGGELEIDEPAGTRAFKLPAGAAVLYPANSLHRVAPVMRGRRNVAVGWLQSMVRDHDKRRIIFELENARAGLFAESGKTPLFDVLTRNTSDLWRMWVDP